MDCRNAMCFLENALISPTTMPRSLACQMRPRYCRTMESGMERKRWPGIHVQDRCQRHQPMMSFLPRLAPGSVTGMPETSKRRKRPGLGSRRSDWLDCPYMATLGLLEPPQVKVRRGSESWRERHLKSDADSVQKVERLVPGFQGRTWQQQVRVVRRSA